MRVASVVQRGVWGEGRQAGLVGDGDAGAGEKGKEGGERGGSEAEGEGSAEEQEVGEGLEGGSDPLVREMRGGEGIGGVEKRRNREDRIKGEGQAM